VASADAVAQPGPDDPVMPSPLSHPEAATAAPSATDVTLGSLLLSAFERHAGRVAFRWSDRGATRELTFGDLDRTVREVAGGLVALGLAPGDRVAVLGGTCPDWTVADCAALCAGAVVVPIYQTNSPEECRYVLEHSGARAVICEDAAQLAKVEAVHEHLPGLEHVLSFADLQALRDRAGDAAEGEVDRRVAAATPDDVATIVYTSGTTGPPKGCVLTHANCAATVLMYRGEVRIGPEAVVFMFLPLAHVLARVTQWVALDVGGTIAFWSGDPKRLLEDLEAARPTHFPSVPRVFEKVHTRALAAADDGGPVKRRVFEAALALGRRARRAERGGQAGPMLRPAHALADRLVLSKVRDLFGGRLELALTGAAPIGREVLEFFDACGVLVLEGYGMTETCAAATLNAPQAFRFGTVGKALPGTEVSVAGDGEILLRGPNVFPGYYRNEEATAETLSSGGWIRTGDLGSLDEDGYLSITGRKKDLIITSSGKNVTPSNLETALRESRWISQAVVFGDRRPYLVALLTLDPEEAPALAEQLGIEPDVGAMSRDPIVHAALQDDVDAVNARFARIEQIKSFALLDHDLAQAAGELTPTLKVKRPVVYDHYRETFDALYA
jgi:long-chain acyl-CoA synthetase